MKVTVIGGGTGSTNVLTGLKQYRDLELSVIVNMTDNGGSNEVVRDEFGYLPLSDLRKSILALSEDNQENLRELFNYRFSKGVGLSGHTLGNLIMMALSDITGSEQGAIDATSEIFDVVGTIIPVTYDSVQLVATMRDGEVVEGEHLIDEAERVREIVDFKTDQPARATDQAVKAIMDADYIVVGPGDVYTSTLANFVISGIPETFARSKAQKILIPNLVSKKGQTTDMHTKEYLDVFEKYTGSQFDYILVNSGRIPPTALKRYQAVGEHVVEDNLSEDRAVKKVTQNIVADGIIKKVDGDTIVRSLVRHDPEKLGVALYSIFKGIYG